MAHVGHFGFDRLLSVDPAEVLNVQAVTRVAGGCCMQIQSEFISFEYQRVVPLTASEHGRPWAATGRARHDPIAF